ALPVDHALPVDYALSVDYALPVDHALSDDSSNAVLFYDGFEDLSLSPWVVSGPGKPWVITSDASASGSQAAQAQATGSSKESLMTATFSSPGSGTLTLEYQRRLVGLDGVDDFAAEIRFGAIWIALEQLASSTANDPAFVAKSFVIPNTADAIRFMCECGAVSERCLVDDVKVIHTP
ncbi:MAG: hypothetical protein KAI47_14430, partial [Deltaproteobacteria bacterium]|nr:hypothetical protein [Deltaproteobacteria bacterium]